MVMIKQASILAKMTAVTNRYRFARDKLCRPLCASGWNISAFPVCTA
jgi:hypothetical protein